MDSRPEQPTPSRLSRRQFLRMIAGASAAGALLAACGRAAPASPASAPTSPPATSGPITVDQNATVAPAPAATAAAIGKAGGTFTFSRGSDSNNLDPVTQDGNVDIWILMNIYDQLVRVNDAGTEIVPALAEKWEITPDNLTYTFHLRQGVKFSDDTPLKSSDVKYSLDRAKTNKKSGWTFSLEALKEVATPDDNTVVITLTQPWVPFLSDLAMFNASVISEAFGKKVGEEGLVEQTMGTGPFALGEWKKGEYILLKKNPNYWEAGLPLLEEVKITVVPDDNNRILQLQGSQIDGMYDVPLNRVSELNQDPKLTVKQFTSTYNNFIALNTREGPLADVKVRQALNYATDKAALIKVVNFGIGEISNSFMPNGALYWNKDQVGYPFDLEKAKSLMAESKSASGAKIAIQIQAGAASALQLATALKEMWSKIGIELDIQQLEQAVVTDNYRSNKFEAYATGWTNDIIDPDELVSYAIIPDNFENYHTGWINDEAVEMAKKGRTVLDDAGRRTIYYRIQELHMQDAPFVYLYVLPYTNVLTKKIDGFLHHPMGQWVFAKTSVSA
ncbi:MAG: ABC transporter substrate-binding protein [Roseiflexaceae bacterium]|nr:ABC transporter substrate-binding protein [Roseiflexaceae bacterium]